MTDTELARALARILDVEPIDNSVIVDEPTEDPDPSRLHVTFRGGDADVYFALRHPDDYSYRAFDARAQARWGTALLRKIFANARVVSLEVAQKPDYFGELYRKWLADVIAQAPLRHLESFAWGNQDEPCFVELPPLDAALEAMPALRTLTLWAEWDEADLVLPSTVRDLGLITLRPASVEALVAQDLDHITDLRLQLYDYGNEGEPEMTVEDLDDLWDAALPALQRIVFHQATCGSALVAALPEASWFAHLHEVGLCAVSDGTSYVDVATVETLLSEAFAHLRVDVTGTFADARREPPELLTVLAERSGGRIYTHH